MQKTRSDYVGGGDEYWHGIEKDVEETVNKGWKKEKDDDNGYNLYRKEK